MTDADIRPSGTPTFAARQRWEYKIVEGSMVGTGAGLEDHLNTLGAKGWEVCGFETHRTVGALQRRVILKRPVLIAAVD